MGKQLKSMRNWEVLPSNRKYEWELAMDVGALQAALSAARSAASPESYSFDLIRGCIAPSSQAH